MSLEAVRDDLHFAASWRETLNPAQLSAVTHTSGPLLIVAGAGTGKTWTLACRVAHLIESGVPAQQILLLTFSRRAAQEMLSRAQTIVGGGATARVWGGTFHAIANRLLRMHGGVIGVRPDFTVLDQADAADLLNLIRTSLHPEARQKRFARKETLASIYSRVVNAGRPLTEIVDDHFPWCHDDIAAIAEIFTHYTTRKREQNILDYDDLLIYWAALAESSAGDRMAAQFEHVLVDEYQDTNLLQAQLLQHLHRRIANITAVGDDAQAIYSFRSATVENILTFATAFPGARMVKLEENYRSTPPLLAASNAVIALSPQRHEKTLVATRRGHSRAALITCFDESQQASAVCESVLEDRERGIPLMRQAVLFRTSHHSDVLEVELGRRNIPFVKYGGLKFLEAAHVKDVIALLRVLENPRDSVSWFRTLQLVEGIGPAHAQRLLTTLNVSSGDGHESALHRLIAEPPALPDASVEAMTALRSALADCCGPIGGPDIPLASQVERIRRYCEPVFARIYTNADIRLRDIEQLEGLAAAATSRAAFLTDLALDPPSSTADLAGPPLLDEDFLILSTIHSAKGCEWDSVRVLHAADGMIPSDMSTGDAASIEEERRLLYVAMTRARDSLEIYFPLRYYRRPRGQEDRHGYAQLSRFITDATRLHFDERTLCPTIVVDPLVVHDGPVVDLVSDRLTRLWTV